jgi:hypothetical protein
MPYADGRPGTRPVTLRDAKKLGLVPGVSGVSRCAAAPGLELWKARQVLLAALTLSRNAGENDDAYCARIMADSQEQAKKAAEKGTAIHAAIQDYLQRRAVEGETNPFVQAVYGELERVFPEADEVWYVERAFACPLGFGGKVDAFAARGSAAMVVDFKTKEFTGDELAGKKQLAWDDHCIQLAAYRTGLGMPKARCANVFVSVNEPGLAVVHEWPEEDLERGWRMFLALLQYWQAKNKYNSSWMPEKVAA